MAVLFLNWERCEEVNFLDEIDGIFGGKEATAVEMHGLDGMCLLKEEIVPEVAVSPRSW